MIGVFADQAEHSVIREFFELFKTPWDFYRSDASYDVLICSNTNAKFQNTSAKLVLIYGSAQTSYDCENGVEILSQSSNRTIDYKGDRIAIYGNCLTFRGQGTHFLSDQFTREPTALGVAAGGKRFVRIGFDLFQEVHYLLTNGQPISNARIPTLELHIALLRDLILDCSIPLVEIPPVPPDHNFIACLTHDVDHAGIRNHKLDHTVFGFLYRATLGSLIAFFTGRRTIRQLAANWLAAFSLPFVYLGRAKDFWNQFCRYVELEKDVPSTFFIVPKKGDPGQRDDGPAPSKRATRYDVEDVAEQIGRLISAGREVGCHGIDAWRDPTEGRIELERIQSVTGISDIGVRSHWLYRNQSSAATLEQAGFAYDSTIGYNGTIGYHAGTSQVFKPIDAEALLELPMHIMDTALFYPAHMNLYPRQASCAMNGLMENANRFGGVLTINWHDRSIAPERLWDGSYIRLLDGLKKRKPWFATAGEAVSWFRKRRLAKIENLANEDRTVRVKVSPDQRNHSLPGLRIRMHKVSARLNSSLDQGRYHNAFVDLTVNESGELEIPADF